MVNMLDAMDAVQKEITRRQDEFAEEMAGLTSALKVLRNLNEACPRCRGAGWKLRERACAEDDRPNPDDPADRIRCGECGGSGKIKRGSMKA